MRNVRPLRPWVCLLVPVHARSLLTVRTYTQRKCDKILFASIVLLDVSMTNSLWLCLEGGDFNIAYVATSKPDISIMSNIGVKHHGCSNLLNRDGRNYNHLYMRLCMTHSKFRIACNNIISHTTWILSAPACLIATPHVGLN